MQTLPIVETVVLFFAHTKRKEEHFMLAASVCAESLKKEKGKTNIFAQERNDERASERERKIRETGLRHACTVRM
jgi:hypothetical protein